MGITHPGDPSPDHITLWLIVLLIVLLEPFISGRDRITFNAPGWKFKSDSQRAILASNVTVPDADYWQSERQPGSTYVDRVPSQLGAGEPSRRQFSLIEGYSALNLRP
jgi:hypothetical protein